MKKLYLMLLTMLFCVVSTYAQSFEVNGISYNVTKQPTDESSGEVEVTGGSADITNLVIPEIATNNDTKYAVTSIKAYAFNGQTNIITIDIAGSVKTIGSSAFQECYNVKNITFHEGLERMEGYSFESLNSLQTLDLPSSLTYIGEWAFRNANTLTEIVFPDNITEICQYAFEWNRSLKTVYLPKNVQTIGTYAFNHCPLQDVYCLTNTTPTLGISVFPSNTTIYVYSSLSDSFANEEGWKDYNFEVIEDGRCMKPSFSLNDYKLTISSTEGATIYYTTDETDPTTSSILYTEPITFDKNGIVKAVAIKDGMTDSQVSVFEKNDFTVDYPQISMSDDLVVTMTTTVPNGIIYYVITKDWIGRSHSGSSDGGFANGISTEDFLSRYECVEYQEPFTLDHSTSIYACVVKEGWKNQTNSIRLFDTDSKYNLSTPSVNWDSTSKIITITADEGATIYYSLDGSDPTVNSMTYTEPIAINRNLIVKAIAVMPEHFNSNITSYTITDVDSKFYIRDCGLYFRLIDNTTENVVEVTTSDNYTGDITIPSITENNGKSYTVTRVGDNAFSSKPITSVVLPPTIESIGQSAFYNCYALTGLILPNSVKTIESNAFSCCRQLVQIEIPSSVKQIKDGAFTSCYALKKVIFHEGLQSIGNGAFRFCSSIQNLQLPESLTDIGTEAFKNCSSLASITLPSTLSYIPASFLAETGLISIEIPSSVKTVGYSAFSSCNQLTSVKISEGIEKIENQAFDGCNELFSIVLPSTLTTVENYAFYGTSLSTVTLPENLSTLGNSAFGNCASLTSVYSLAATPPAMPDGNAFNGVSSHATLFVNADVVSTYENTNYWAEFSDISSFDQMPCVQPTFVFSNYKLSISSLTQGATIYYTTDGSDPTTSSTLYTGPITFDKSGIVKAVAVKEGLDNSLVSTFEKEFTVDYPTIIMSDDLVVTMTTTVPNGKIYYIVTNDWIGRSHSGSSDGSYANDISTEDFLSRYECLEYQEPFKLDHSTSIYACVIKEGWNNQAYSIRLFDTGSKYNLSTPSVNWDSTSKIITITADEGTTIYYTLDGTDPSATNGTRYTEPIAIERNLIVKSIAIQTGKFNSDINTYQISDVNTDFVYEGINYRLIANTLADEVELFDGEQCEGDVTIPEKVITSNGKEYTVVHICNHAFSECNGLTSITIPNCVTSIGNYAFYDCQKLSSITIPSSVTSIARNTFSNCNKLNDIKVIVVDYSEFCNNNIVSGFNQKPIQLLDTDGNEITEYIIPEGVTSIGDQAFHNCSGLTSVTIPNSAKSIGAWAFRLCSSLTSINIPEGVTRIEDATFFGCSSLTSVTIPNSVTTIDGPAFGACSNLNSVIFGDQLTTIGSEAFKQCTSLLSITIPNSVKSIGENAFWDCSNIKMIISEITTPFDVHAGWPNDATLVVPKGSREAYKNVSGWNFAFTFEEDAILERKQTDEQGIYYTLKADDGSFYYAVTGHSEEMDTEIVIPADLDGCPVKSIEYAFNGCTNLSSIIIPKSVTTIGSNAFNSCTAITSIIIPNSVTSIGYSAFSGCYSLASVKMGKNVSNIGEYAFKNCSSLTSITLPDVLESIGNYAFSNCALTSVNIPGSVKSIGNSAFNGCGSLASVTFEEIEEGITSIGERTFESCALTSITIPNRVKSLGGYAFSRCENLTTAILGDGITEIKGCMFEFCYALTSVTIPEGVTSIGGHAFYNCNALTSIKLPETLTSMEVGTFNNCGLKSIELPNSFTTIPDNLFSSNNFLYIKLGNNVKSIGKNAFGSRELLLEIGTSTPPAIVSDAFPNVEYLSDITVIVPDTKAETAYRKAAVWQEMTFANQNNIAEVTVETPGDLSFELITQCNIMPAKVVGMKVNGTINADDFTQMLVNMKSLLRLDLSDCNITAVPDDALNGKTQLQELTLPTGLQTIGKNAFRNCPYLTGELNLPSTLTSVGESAFVGTAYTSVKLPSTLKTIGDYAFNNVPIKQKLTLPNRVTGVGAHAFEGTQITELVIYDGMKSIGDYAFAGTPIQGHVTIPDGVTYLGRGAFSNTQISTVFLPNSITTLSQGLFQGCPNLNTVYVPDNYTALSSYVFEGCGALTILRLSANLTSMEEYSLQNIPLEYIKVPSQVEVLSHGVLKNCKNLTSLSLPANLKSVENEALYGCTALRNLSVEAIDPPTIKDRSAIRGINTDLCLISIPTQSYRKYVLAEYWGQFVQMRNDIAVETSGNGEIAFEGVDEEGTEDEEEVQPDGTDVTENEFEEDSKTHVSNGSSIYVPQEGKVRFYIMPAEGEKLVSATLDGEDITPYIEENVYVATADKKNAKLVVNFSDAGQGGTILPGDVNDDGEVSVTDVGCVINYILEQIPEPFIYAAADMNGDDEISVTDVGYIINYILNDGASYSRAIRRATYSYGAPTLTADNNGYVLAMDGADAFIGFQMDVIVPGDAKGCNVQLKKKDTGHQLACRRLSNGHYRMVCYSPVNETFSKGITDLLTITSEGDMAVRNIRFTTESLDEVRFADISATPTGIANVVTDQKATDVEVYTLDGQLYRVVHARPGENPLKDLEPGIYLINKRKFIVR